MRSGISGICGVVAELMEVPEGFETAVETALGGQMQNIVCDTDESAKEAVSLLKKNRAGRLTFLPAASIKGSRVYPDSRITKDSGYRGLAADCITCRDEYRTIFDYLLGRVVIAADMEAAIRMSKKSGSGFRFVTLDGEIINISGAITGGKYKNKTANLLERRNEIAALEKEIEKLSEEASEIAETGRNIDTGIAENDEKTEKLANSQRQAELAGALSESNLKALRETMERISSSREKFDAELSSIERDSADAETTVEELLAEAEKAKESAKQMESKAEDALAAYEAKKTVLEQASEKITASRIAAAEWESKQSNLESLLTRISNSVEDYAFQIETKENELTNICAEKNEILFGADGTLERTEKLIAEKQETEERIEKTAAQRAALSAGLSDADRQQQIYSEQLNSCRDGKYQLEIKIAKNETQLDTLKEKLWEEFEVSYAQAEDLRKSDFAMGPSVKESREIRGRLRDLGEVNVGAIKEYESVSRRYEFLTGQRKDIVVAMDELAGIINEMDTTIKTRFKENFDQVVDNFEVIFRELFGGGHAELSLEDENNPLESGIDIVAQPPGKKLQNINLMSGGEKTMTAIALMFAVLKTKPTPFCILDEVEAALDDANIDRFSRYLRKFDNIQFALVTHQKATMEHADVLYGVTMPEQGVSKVLSLRLGDDFEM